MRIEEQLKFIREEGLMRLYFCAEDYIELTPSVLQANPTLASIVGAINDNVYNKLIIETQKMLSEVKNA